MKIFESTQAQLSIAEYYAESARTDRLDKRALTPVLFGLFGEVGSLMATSKKYHREKKAYAAFKEAVVEEFGDTLWYLAAVCRRIDFDLDEILNQAIADLNISSDLLTTNVQHEQLERVRLFTDQGAIDTLLRNLGQQAASLLEQCSEKSILRERLIAFSRIYLQTVQTSIIPLSLIVQTNISKTHSLFLNSKASELPDFDAGFPEEERIPNEFRIEIKLRAHGKSYLSWNGEFIGDPLSDNIEEPDGYRFHDVFHLAHAAVLHWSPTFRALIRQKRKSDPNVDANQDGGRAIVMEEGLTTYIFSCAKDLNYFEGQNSISLDILKTISKFVRGFEVERCPLSLWESAILQGYEVFRLLKAHNGGVVKGNRTNRTITYEKLE